ncbi:MAG: hypothetical protein ACM3XS_01870 [Bacteroidota bacterium]
MRRFALRMALALLFLFALSTKFVDINICAGFGRHPAEIAWAATGLDAERFTLDYWAAVQAGTARVDPREMVRKAASRLGIREPAVFAGQTGGIRFANLDGVAVEGGEAVLTLQAGERETALGISLVFDRLPPDILRLERRIRLAVSGIAPRGGICWAIRGRRPGRLRDESWRAMWARVLGALEGARRGETRGDDLIEAYSPLLRGTGENGINLVLLRRYEPDRRTTLVVVASPNLAEAD